MEMAGSVESAVSNFPRQEGIHHTLRPHILGEKLRAATQAPFPTRTRPNAERGGDPVKACDETIFSKLKDGNENQILLQQRIRIIINE